MKKGYLILLIILILFFISVLSIFLLGRSIFIVKNIRISKDFNVNKENLLDYLNIYPIRAIWEYDTELMNEMLSKNINLKEYKVSKLYPNTLSIKLMMRKPLAKIVGKNGAILDIDNDGIIFKYTGNENILRPLIILNVNNQIKSGIKIGGRYKEFIDSIYNLRENHSSLFNSISQIDLDNSNEYQLNYTIYFKTILKGVYLKNRIDVDSIYRGLSSAIFLNYKNYNDKKIVYTGNSFVISNN